MALSLDTRASVRLGKMVGSNFVQTTPLGVWDGFSGGDVDSDDTKYRAGGRAAEESLGGTRTVSNVTLKRLFRIERDFDLLQKLIDGAGSADVQIVRAYLDPSNTSVNSPAMGNVVYRGKLKAVKQPEHDSNSTDASMIEIECTVGVPYTARV